MQLTHGQAVQMAEVIHVFASQRDEAVKDAEEASKAVDIWREEALKLRRQVAELEQLRALAKDTIDGLKRDLATSNGGASDVQSGSEGSDL
jgi:hypothetical protein